MSKKDERVSKEASMAGDMQKHRRSSGAKSGQIYRAREAGRRIEAFMKKSQANGAESRNAMLRAKKLLSRLGL